MLGPRSAMIDRTRPGVSVYGPSSGNPATTESSPDAAGDGANVSAGAVRSGTSSTARSVCGSYRTTVASRLPAPVSTTARSDPATTCALVITLPRPMTRPVPSIRRAQDSATARTFRIDSAAASTPAEDTTCWFGGSTAVFGVGANGSRMAGKPELLNTSRSRVDRSWAWLGMTSSTLPSTAEPRMAEDSQGNGTAASGTAISQMTSSTASAFPKRPRVRSTACAGRQLIFREIARPTVDPAISPTPTPTITQAIPIAILAVESSTSPISIGASQIATIAPAIAVTSVNIAVTKPCRKPATAAAITSRITTTSTQLIPVIAPPSRGASQARPPRSGRRADSADRSLGKPRSSHTRQVEDAVGVPRHRPAAQLQQRVDQAGGESPHQQVGDPERGAHPAVGQPHLTPVGRIGQFGNRHPGHCRSFRRVDGAHLPRLTPVGQHGADQEAGRGQEQLREQRHRKHRGRVQTRLLVPLAQRGGHS